MGKKKKKRSGAFGNPATRNRFVNALYQKADWAEIGAGARYDTLKELSTRYPDGFLIFFGENKTPAWLCDTGDEDAVGISVLAVDETGEIQISILPWGSIPIPPHLRA